MLRRERERAAAAAHSVYSSSPELVSLTPLPPLPPSFSILLSQRPYDCMHDGGRWLGGWVGSCLSLPLLAADHQKPEPADSLPEEFNCGNLMVRLFPGKAFLLN